MWSAKELIEKQEKSARARSGRRKGVNFERDIAKTFTEWWGEPFTRTSQYTNLYERSSENAGDLAAPNSFPFCVECKRVEFTLSTIFTGKSSQLSKYWKQAQEQAKKSQKLPLLVFKRNYWPKMVILLNGEELPLIHNRLYTSLSGDNVVLFTLNEFTSLNKSIIHQYEKALKEKLNG